MMQRQAGSFKARVGPHRVAASERRRYSRLAVRLPVRCRRLTARASQTWRGHTADVSSGGFAVELPTRLPPGTPLAVEVRTGIGPLWMEAEVVWTCCVPERAGIIRHGVCLANRSEILDLPIGILLGQWLQGVAKREGTRADASPLTQERRKT